MMPRDSLERTGALAVAAAAGAVLVGTTVIAARDRVPGWEADAFRAVNDLPDALEPFMWAFQLAGLLLTPLAVAALAAATRRRWLALCLVALIPLKLLTERGVIKQLVERPRPGVSLCHGDPTCATFRNVPLDGSAYVSGHAVVAWSVATLLVPYLGRRGRLLVVAVAGLSSVARVYLGAHNPLDVVGGAALGVLVGAGLQAAVEPARRDRQRGPNERHPSPSRPPDLG